MDPVDDPATVLRSTHRPLPLLPRGGTQTPHNHTRGDAPPQAISPPPYFRTHARRPGHRSHPALTLPVAGVAFSGRPEDCRHE